MGTKLRLPIINPALSTVAVTSRAEYRTESAGDKSSEPTIKHPKLLPMSNSCWSSKLNEENPKTM